MLKQSFWQNKKVFITGHTGFKGAWLSLLLHHLGAEVIGYALKPPTEPSLFDVCRVEERISSFEGDICDSASLLRTITQSQPEIVIHMAAQPLVFESYLNPVDTYMTNVMGTVHLLDAVRQTDSVKVVLNVTTDKVYQNQERRTGFVESDRLGGVDPYSNSKACSELVTQSYWDAFLYKTHVTMATARAGNVIGGGDWAKNRLIPDVFQSFFSRKPVVLRHPDSIRPWQHVLDVLYGYLLLTERLWHERSESTCSSWNFGPPEESCVTVSQMVEELSILWGPDARWKVDTAVYPKETHTLMLNSYKAQQYLGWQINLPLRSALAWTVDWYKAYVRNEDMLQYTLSQIKAYESLLVNRNPVLSPAK